MTNKKTLDAMVRAIHGVPQLNGMMIVYMVNGRSSVLHHGLTPMRNYAKGFVVIEEISGPNARFEIGMGVAPPAPTPQVVTNRSMLAAELSGLGIQLVMTGISALGVAGGLALEVPSAGGSTILVYASWVGLGSSLLQSANAAVRVGEILRNPDKNSLQVADGGGDSFYANFMTAVDGIGVLAGFMSWPSALKAVWPSLKQLMKLRGINVTEQTFAGMKRIERGRFVRQLLEDSGRDPRAKIYLQTIAKHYDVAGGSLTRSGGLSHDNAITMARAINQQAKLRVADALLNAGSTPAGAFFSGMKSEQVGSASGSVRWGIDHAPGAATYMVHILTPSNASAPVPPGLQRPRPGARFY